MFNRRFNLRVISTRSTFELKAIRRIRTERKLIGEGIVKIITIVMNEKKNYDTIVDEAKLQRPAFSFSDTSRPPRPGEINGKEYHFVTREKMEEEIEAGKFIEYGEYKGNLYGTNSESVSSLVNAGYVCLLNPHYQALKMLRTSQLRPYVVYVKPPRFEMLKETRNEARARSTFDESNSRGFTVKPEFLMPGTVG